MELKFNVTLNGQTGDIICDDAFFNYVAYRSIFPEQLCLELINAIKQLSHKKMAIIWGNCQTEQLQRFLMSNFTFSKEYFIVKLPPVFSYESILCFQENFWSLCDLFISQRVRKDNRFSSKVSTQNLPARLPEDTKIIWIPNIYFDGYFPQLKNARKIQELGEEIYSHFRMADRYVDEFMNTPGGGGDWYRRIKKFH